MQIIKAKYEFLCESPLLLNEWQSTAVRGALANSMKENYCIHQKRGKCTNTWNCPYGYIFETTPGKNSRVMSAYKQVTRPYVLDAFSKKTTYKKGKIFSFELSYFGKASRHINEVESCIESLPPIGRNRETGYGKITFKKKSYFDSNSNSYTDKLKFVIPEKKDFGNNTEITFLHPTLLVRENAVKQNPSFRDIVQACARKYSAISFFHFGRQIDYNWAEINKELDKAECIDANLEPVILQRYSSRLKELQRYPAIRGTIEFRTDDITKFQKEIQNFLEFGKYSHIGKFSSFGLGLIDYSFHS